jgi:hypothetical protein
VAKVHRHKNHRRDHRNKHPGNSNVRFQKLYEVYDFLPELLKASHLLGLLLAIRVLHLGNVVSGLVGVLVLNDLVQPLPINLFLLVL